MRRLNRDEVMQIQRLGGFEVFVSERNLYSMRSVILSQRRERYLWMHKCRAVLCTSNTQFYWHKYG